MNIWLMALGLAVIGIGIFTLLIRERMLRWSQKYLRQNVGEVGRAFAESGKSRHMVGPVIGAVVIGVIVTFQAVGR